jgi:O-antigen/teichoic acid export membrane protein
VAQYLRRLATTGAAYTASSILSKLVAVALLPLYTRHLSPSDYGAAEVLLSVVIATSIVIRLGVLEAVMRFYYQGGEDRGAVVSTAFASLFWTATAGAAAALAAAGPISSALLGHEDAGLARVAILGLWIFTMTEFLLTLYRLDERAKAFLAVTIGDTLITIPLTVYLVIGLGQGAHGLLLGNFASTGGFLLVLLLSQRRRLALWPEPGLLRRMVRFGLPTMPAELSLYSLNLIDRIVIVRSAGLAEAGLYSLGLKFAQAINILVRGFQLAWPPLAYSISDDGEARRTYALVVSYFAAICAFVVTGMWLLSRWLLHVFAAPQFFAAFKGVGPLATAIVLYGLYLVLVVILGRSGRTEFNFPATGAALAVNVGLNLLLVPRMGFIGAAVALIASYVVVLVLMYLFTRRLFSVPYQWWRLLQVIATAAALIAAGELLAPKHGAAGLLARVGLWATYPLALWLSGFFTAAERSALGALLSPRQVAARLRSLRAAPAGVASGSGEGFAAEVLESEARDEDLRT